MNAETAGAASTGARSAQLYERACRVIPGGVSSPVRAFRAVGGTPLFIERGAGQHLYDVDGRRYLDLVNSWGALISGARTSDGRRGDVAGMPQRHDVWRALSGRGGIGGADHGLLPRPRAGALCLFRHRGGHERDSRGARGERPRSHRQILRLLSRPCRSSARRGRLGPCDLWAPVISRRAGGLRCGTRVLPLDDEEALRELFAAEGARIAAVIIEPMPANHGLLLQRRAFLQTLAATTAHHGALLIFDEVISGFRLARGGVAQLTGITPDMATFGKVIGGGMPVGAFGGSRRVMANLAPDGDAYQAGTLSGNPVAMAAGLTTLNLLTAGSVWQQLETLGAKLEATLRPGAWQGRHFR